MSGLEDPRPEASWDAFREARERFFARVRPEAMDHPPQPLCPNVWPLQWTDTAKGPDPDAAG